MAKFWAYPSRCPFVPGQKKILVLLSLCPGTRAAAKIPGQTPLSREVPEKTTTWLAKKIKNCQIKNCNYFTLFSFCPGTKEDRLSKLAIFWACPGTIKDFLSLPPRKMRGHLFLCPAGQENPVPLDSLWYTTWTYLQPHYGIGFSAMFIVYPSAWQR